MRQRACLSPHATWCQLASARLSAFVPARREDRVWGTGGKKETEPLVYCAGDDVHIRVLLLERLDPLR